MIDHPMDSDLPLSSYSGMESLWQVFRLKVYLILHLYNSALKTFIKYEKEQGLDTQLNPIVNRYLPFPLLKDVGNPIYTSLSIYLHAE